MNKKSSCLPIVMGARVRRRGGKFPDTGLVIGFASESRWIKVRWPAPGRDYPLYLSAREIEVVE